MLNFDTVTDLRKAVLAGNVRVGELTEEDMTELLDNELCRDEYEIDDRILDACNNGLMRFERYSNIKIPDIKTLYRRSDNSVPRGKNRKMFILIPIIAAAFLILAVTAVATKFFGFTFNENHDSIYFTHEPGQSEEDTSLLPEITEEIIPASIREKLVQTEFMHSYYPDAHETYSYRYEDETGEKVFHLSYTRSFGWSCTEIPQDEDYEPEVIVTANGNVFTVTLNIEMYSAVLTKDNITVSVFANCTHDEFISLLEEIVKI